MCDDFGVGSGRWRSHSCSCPWPCAVRVCWASGRGRSRRHVPRQGVRGEDDGVGHHRAFGLRAVLAPAHNLDGGGSTQHGSSVTVSAGAAACWRHIGTASASYASRRVDGKAARVGGAAARQLAATRHQGPSDRRGLAPCTGCASTHGTHGLGPRHDQGMTADRGGSREHGVGQGILGWTGGCVTLQ